MLTLAYPLADSAVIDGIEYELDLSFDNVLRVIDLFNDHEIDDTTQINTAFLMLLRIDLDIDIEQKQTIVKQILKDELGTMQEYEPQLDIAGNPMPNAEKEKKSDYCLKQDAEYIYASFMADYHMDLKEQMGKLHWHKFNALLQGLNSDTIFKRIIEIRTSPLPTGKGTSEARKNMIDLKKRYRLKGEKEEVDENENN